MKALSPPRLLAASAVACFLLPSCDRITEAKNDPKWWGLETERVELASQVELLELKLSKLSPKSSIQTVAKLEAEVKRAESRRVELAAERDVLKQDIEIAKADMESMKTEWMRSVRTAATGREFAKLTGIGGRTYENAVVTRVTDVGVEFRHATGSARLAANDLTPAQHEMFGLDQDLSGEAIRQEKETALAYHSKVDAVVAAREAKEQKEAARMTVAAASKPAARETPSFASASVDTTTSRSRLSDPPKSVGSVNYRSSRSSTYYYSSYYYRPYYYRYYAPQRYRPSASVLYDPYTGGSPVRKNVNSYGSSSGGSIYSGSRYGSRSSGGGIPASSMRPSSNP